MNILEYNKHPVNSNTLPEPIDSLSVEYKASGASISRATPGETPRAGIRQEAGGEVNSLPAPAQNSKASQAQSSVYECGSLAIFTECETGQHHFAKKILCGKEWCPVCGEDGSQAHNRRIARWLPKFQQISQLGYFVIEFPDRYRKVPDYAYSKKALRLATNKVIDVLAGERKARSGKARVGGHFDRGLVRWHWFGDKVPGKWNPHLNVAVDGAYLDAKKLAQIKAELKQALKCKDLIVHYSYFEKPGEIYHKLKYITRPTFQEKGWDEYMAREIRNFRNMREWGSWGEMVINPETGKKKLQFYEPVWDLTPAIEADAQAIHDSEKLGSGECPDCGAPLKKWSRPVDSGFLTVWGAVEMCNTGYYRIPHHEWQGGELSPAVRLKLDELESRSDKILIGRKGYSRMVIYKRQKG